MSANGLVTIRETSFETKARRPSKWSVIMELSGNKLVPCHICVLTHVFNIDDMDAIAHLLHAAQDGRAVIMEAYKDIAESKADDGNRLKDYKEQTCLVQAGNMSFKAEPLS